ncbi:efflux RND transporter periplasmic adaptor subunit [Neptuniibacter sp. 1_MG-2023]|jgi:multidrug efflux system membrane fusion protein|uniref:efflux RND transporter periplasmic adaptor subunit n=1 Tax=Neptuniibacter sp. 1_MG-2023 TaxID=3062662 RepID=UPI0026E3884F|nr:efflux RND transporter periplasmic adaptor subunit [Neptuniibacter sp. 1_MG-2023]MDO6594356.1 efflux RND transporter periplasmic adaptor subunit [Neptuniibacter sp. 1_MG-2023]
MSFNKHSKIITISVLLSALVACSEPAEQAKAPAQRPLTQIDVAQVIYKPVQTWFTYTTRLEAPQQVALKPRVSGVVNTIDFVEGQQVKQGDLLFSLDPRPFEAQVASLNAQVASAVAEYQQAKSEAARATRLRKRDAISSEEAESRATAAKKAQAQISALRAQLQAAQLDLEFSKITAPIDGIISRAEITRGNTVNANQSTLTSIVSNQKMYAYFDIDERTWNSNFEQAKASDNLPVVMQLLGSEQFTYKGHVDFIDNQINTSTGTLRVRATFIDDDHKLRSGAFARIRLASQEAKQQVLIPERAIGTDLKNRFVLIVDDKNTLQYRPISVGDRYGEFRAITAGLGENDIIAVNGPAKVGPGMPIEPRTTQLNADAIGSTLSAPKTQTLLTAK